MKQPKLADLINQDQFRIIPSIYPPINFFEKLVDPTEMEALWHIESLTNDRLLEEAGNLALVRAQDRVSGVGASVVMAAFTHISRDRPSRFSDGSFGIYYAGLSMETAIRETVWHREQFMRYTRESAGELMMRLYKGKIKKLLHDVRDCYPLLHDPNHYHASQQFGHRMRDECSWGLIYNSVRNMGGNCIAAFRPPAVSLPVPTDHLRYLWDGTSIIEVLSTNTVLRLSM